MVAFVGIGVGGSITGASKVGRFGAYAVGVEYSPHREVSAGAHAVSASTHRSRMVARRFMVDRDYTCRD
jgi:hypothetical protein